MRVLFAVGTAALVLLSLGLLAQEKGPDKIVYDSKLGNVTFDHAKHVEREKNDCTVCHDKLWPQKKGNLGGYGLGMHKPAEAKKTSCAACHVKGGKSFESVGNCVKCHIKGKG